MYRQTLRNAAIPILALIAPLVSSPASAGRVDMQDFAQDTIEKSNYYQNGMDGQWWHTPDTSIIGPSTSNLTPLVLDFGNGPTAGIRFQFTQDGRVNFLDSTGKATGDYIEPMHSATGYDNGYDNGHYTDGLLDPSYLTATSLPNGAFDPAKGLKAFRFAWDASCPNSIFNKGPGFCNDNGFVDYQAVLIEIDPEDFQLQFNYLNTPAALALAAAGGNAFTGSFKIGANIGTYAGPFLDSGPNFCFHDGTLVDCAGVAAIPEPDTLSLAALGLTSLAAAAACRRRRMAVIRRDH